MAPERTNAPSPNLVTPRAPPEVPVELAITSAMVKVPPEALVVSKPKIDPAFMPLVALLLAARLVSRVVTLPVVNSPVPPTFSARVAVLFTLSKAAVLLGREAAFAN